MITGITRLLTCDIIAVHAFMVLQRFGKQFFNYPWMSMVSVLQIIVLYNSTNTCEAGENITSWHGYQIGQNLYLYGGLFSWGANICYFCSLTHESRNFAHKINYNTYAYHSAHCTQGVTSLGINFSVNKKIWVMQYENMNRHSRLYSQ